MNDIIPQWTHLLIPSENPDSPELRSKIENILEENPFSSFHAQVTDRRDYKLQKEWSDFLTGQLHSLFRSLNWGDWFLTFPWKVSYSSKNLIPIVVDQLLSTLDTHRRKLLELSFIFDTFQQSKSSKLNELKDTVKLILLSVIEKTEVEPAWQNWMYIVFLWFSESQSLSSDRGLYFAEKSTEIASSDFEDYHLPTEDTLENVCDQIVAFIEDEFPQLLKN